MMLRQGTANRINSACSGLLFVGLILIGIGSVWGGCVALGLVTAANGDATLGALGVIASVAAALGMLLTEKSGGKVGADSNPESRVPSPGLSVSGRR